MKKKSLFLAFFSAIVGLVSLNSCTKGCVECRLDGYTYEVCESDGNGRISLKQFKQDCKAAGGEIL